MSKAEDTKLLKIQTSVLKVNIHCDGCKKKVKKVLHKIDGVYRTTVDSDEGKVTVSGDVDPSTLIKKLAKAGKHAELLAPKGGNNSNLQKPQLGNEKGQQKENGKPQKGGGGGKDYKGQQPPPPLPLPPQQQQQLQQMKGFKDLKLPFQKDPRSVKFTTPTEDEGSDYDDFDDYDDDEDLGDLDCFDADFEDDFKSLKIKPTSAPPNGKGATADKIAGGGGGGGGNNKKGGGGGKSGGGPQDSKNGGNNNKAAPNGHGHSNGGSTNNNNNINPSNGGKKGGGKNELGGAQGLPMINPNMMGQPIHNMDVGQMGNIRAPMAHMGNGPAGGAPAGYFQGGMVARPEMMAAMLQQQQQQQQQQKQQQQQQQQMMMMNGQEHGYHPAMMAYPRPPAAAAPTPTPTPYVTQMPPYGEPYTNFFSEESSSSCAIM